MAKQKLKAELLSYGEAIVVEELRKITYFDKRLRQLADQYPDMAQVVYMEYPLRPRTPIFAKDWDTLASRGAFDAVRSSAIDEARLEAYSAKLRELGDSYNLHCDWIVNTLHHLVKGLISPEFKGLELTAHAGREIDRFKLDIPVYPWTRKGRVQRLVDLEWQRIKAGHLELRRRSRVPEYFNLHVRWLCKRLFYGNTGQNMPRTDLGDLQGYVTPDYVATMIRRTAKLLGIRLMRGRPPSTKKYMNKHFA